MNASKYYFFLGILLFSMPIYSQELNTSLLAKNTSEVNSHFANETKAEILILKIKANNHLASSETISLLKDKQIFLPLDFLASTLMFPFYYNNFSQQLTGWATDKEKSFVVDFNTLIIHFKTQKDISISDQDFTFYEDQLFLSLALIDTLISATSTFNYDTQSIQINTQSPTPFDEYFLRQKERNLFEYNKFTHPTSQNTPSQFLKTPLFSWPFLDLAARYNVSRAHHSKAEDYWNYSANASFLTGDFDSTIYLYSNTDEQPPYISINTEKIDESGQILGLFKHLELGDTYSYSHSLLSPSQNGYGFKISTESTLTPDGKTYTFRETLPIGWEVELYRNGELLAYQTNPTDGFYEFKDIPLMLGKNTFKLIFYGPNGQIKEEEKVIFFNGDLVDKNKIRLKLNAINKNRYLIEQREKPRDSSLGHDVLVDFGYGLTDTLTLNLAASMNSLELYNGTEFTRSDRHFISTGVTFTSLGIYSNLNTLFDFKESKLAFDYSAKASIGGADLSLDYVHFGNTITPSNILSNDFIKEQATFFVNKSLDLPTVGTFPASYQFRYFTTQEHDVQQEHYISISKNLWDLYLNVLYQHSHNYTGTRTHQITLTTNKLLGAYTLRSDITYDFIYSKLRTINATTYKDILPHLRGGLKYSYSSLNMLTNDYESKYAFNLNWQTRGGYISLEMGTSDYKNSYAFIGYNISFLPDFKNGNIYPTGSKLQNTGALSALAFMDNNLNGLREPEEPILKDANFVISPTPTTWDAKRSTKRGATILSHLPTYEPLLVSSDLSSIEDTLAISDLTGPQTFMLRPAQLSHLEVPLVGTGDIEGTLFQQKGNKKLPYNGIILNLLNTQTGKIVDTKISEFDGYYVFEKLPMGEYQITLDHTQAKELGISLPPAKIIKLVEFEQLAVSDMVINSTN